MTNELLGFIQDRVLPPGGNFSEEQIDIIFEDNKMDVVAGPGTGKTTVLTARIKVLLEKLQNSKEGMCILTHTNVAVDEIRTTLRKLGVNEINKPHFLGTIQDFFNTFFSKKAFHLVLGDKKMQVLDDEIFRVKFDKEFDFRKTSNYPNELNNPNPLNQKIKWKFDKLDNLVSMVDPKTYSNAFEESISNLFKNGYVTNEQCLQLSKWYISKYRESLRKIFSIRFSYLLLDEAQDTSKLQFELLKMLFDTENVTIQSFGDPYQAIYNVFGKDRNLAWEIDSAAEKRISATSRFGETIVDVVKNVCIKKYDDLKANEIDASFPPYFIVYGDGDDLFNKFQSLILNLERKDSTFKYSKKPDKIVSIQHKDLESTFGENYQRAKVKKLARMSDFELLLDLLLKEFTRANDGDFEEIFKSNEIRIKIFEILKKLNSSHTTSLINELKKLFDKILPGMENSENIVGDVNKMLLEIFPRTKRIKVENEDNDEPKKIEIGTIHSVKGETHRSTLLILNSDFNVGFGEKAINYPILDLLEEYLALNYIPLSQQKSEKEEETEKALKLAYVALSRPTHLVCIGISEEQIKAKSYLLDKLSNAGWEQYEDDF